MPGTAGRRRADRHRRRDQGQRRWAGCSIGAIAAGSMMAIMMANAGGAWDNAKKYIEEPATRAARAPRRTSRRRRRRHRRRPLQGHLRPLAQHPAEADVDRRRRLRADLPVAVGLGGRGPDLTPCPSLHRNLTPCPPLHLDDGEGNVGAVAGPSGPLSRGERVRVRGSGPTSPPVPCPAGTSPPVPLSISTMERGRVTAEGWGGGGGLRGAEWRHEGALGVLRGVLAVLQECSRAVPGVH